MRKNVESVAIMLFDSTGAKLILLGKSPVRAFEIGQLVVRLQIGSEDMDLGSQSGQIFGQRVLEISHLAGECFRNEDNSH